MRDIISSFEILYRDAKASVDSVDTKSQRQQLALSYLRSLVRRIDARLLDAETERDEIRVALCGRARPVFGFIPSGKAIVASPDKTPSIATVKLSGKHQTVHMLRGEIKSFGTQAVCHGRWHSQKVREISIVRS
jgi:hypothetical protein